tara:strand:- start:491 stop:880 length:390 start_codon:yes stop_codon:yes gene_type:complete
MIKAPKFPLRFKEKLGFEDVESTKELVLFHLKNLLLTNPGEKISDPEYGVGLRRFLFEQLNFETVGEIEDRITSQIGQKLSYIDLSEVLVTPFEDINKLQIKIQFSIENVLDNEVLDLEIALNSSETQY